MKKRWEESRRVFLKLTGLTTLLGFTRSGSVIAAAEGPRFLEDGLTVTDTTTGLMWEKKVQSDTLDWHKEPHSLNAACTWNEAKGEWTDRLNADRFAGFSDWRLPSVHELVSIVDYDTPKPPALDPVFGPVVSAFYWTGTPLGFRPGLAWNIFFLDGVVFVDGIGNKNRVRAVRKLS